MKISVAMCTYNGSEFVEEQIVSIFGQTRLPNELIIRDDQSTDDTMAIVERLAKDAPFPVKYAVNDERLGSTKNFEGAIAATACDLIFLADQDDVWLPHKTETVAKLFESDGGLGAVFSDLVIVDKQLQPCGYTMFDYLSFEAGERKRLNEGEAWDLLLNRMLATGAALAFRRDILPHVLPIPPGSKLMIHDRWIAIVAAVVSRLRVLDEALVLYRQHETQQIGANFATRNVNQFGKRRIHSLWAEFYDHLWSRLVETHASRAHPGFAAAFSERRTHFKARVSLPEGWRRRILLVGRELLSGRYGRHSKGLISAARDIIIR